MAQAACLRSSGLGPSPSDSTSLYCHSGAGIQARSPDGLHPKPSGARSAPYGSRNNSYQLDPSLPLAVIDRKTAYVGFNVVALVGFP